MADLLDRLTTLAQELKGKDQQRQKLDQKIEELSKQAAVVLKDAEKQAKKILEEADQAASAIQRGINKAQAALESREKDVALREAAVSGIDASWEALKKKEADVAAALKAAKESKAAAEAEKALWQTRQKELDAAALALGKPTSEQVAQKKVKPVKGKKKKDG